MADEQQPRTAPAGPPRAPETETIGRMPHVLAHVTAQLPGLAAGEERFEDIRVRYGHTMSALAARGLARVTAPRAGIGSSHRYWSSARDLIKELQTLGWVKAGPVPSTRASVDAHRDRRYVLTPAGREVAAQAGSRVVLADLLTDALLRAHPYFRALLGELNDEGPIFCPEVSEGQVQRNSGRRYWAEYAAGLLARSDPRVRLGVDDVADHLASALRRRFGSRRAEGLKPTAKEVAEALSDAFAGASLNARGLHFGATTLDALKSWGTELRLLDQSRYVPGHEGGNLIWLTSDFRLDDDGASHAGRRTFTDHSADVGAALARTYYELRKRPAGDGDTGKSDREYQPIHVVRAGAAAATGTARELGDPALEAMASGQLDVGVEVRLLSARAELPPRSEPMYQRGGTRALNLTMARRHNGTTDTSASAHIPSPEEGRPS
jgi:hypothetical protein